MPRQKITAPPAAPPAPPAPGFVHRSRAAETAEGEAWVPDVRAAGTEPPPPRVESCPPFLLAAYPERWTILGDAVVPEFAKIVIQAGVNGASDLGGRLDINDVRGHVAQKRGVIVPVDCVPPEHIRPGQRPSYIYRPRGRPDVHLLIYERCYPGSDRIERDDAGYARFCAHVAERGILPPPPEYALRKLREKLVRQRDELRAKAADRPSWIGAADEAARQVEVIERVLSETAAEAVPAEADDYDAGAIS